MCRCKQPARARSPVAVRVDRRAAGRKGGPDTLPGVVYGSLVVLLCCSGCLQRMTDQPRHDPLEETQAFGDDWRWRHPVEGTVARGQLQLDEPFFTGKVGNEFVTELPARVMAGTDMRSLLAHGRNRFTVFCSHCHGEVGGGVGGSEGERELMLELVGMVVKRGFPTPPTYHQPRLRDAPLGHFFDVITNGLGRMPAHGYLIPPQDRWAIAAYIQALQYSQHAEAATLPPNDLQRLSAQSAAQ